MSVIRKLAQDTLNWIRYALTYGSRLHLLHGYGCDMSWNDGKDNCRLMSRSPRKQHRRAQIVLADLQHRFME